MDKRRSISIIVLILTITIGIVTNAVSDTFPAEWIPYLRYSPLLLLILVIFLFIFTEVQNRIESQNQRKSPPPTSATEHALGRRDQTFLDLFEHERSVDTLFSYEWKYEQNTVSLEQPLSWGDLCAMCREISASGVSRTAVWYDKRLYLRRLELENKFMDFLASSQTGFILTGSSGVGKSQFLMWLYDSLQTEHPEVCCLIYDATVLPTSSIPLSVQISRDLQKQLPGKQRINVLDEIDRIPGIESRKFILCIDALNENPNPDLLLNQLDQIIRTCHYTWLKVLIVSKPEAWRVISYTIPLGEAKYYQIEGQDLYAIRTHSASSFELKPFSLDELEFVYKNYQDRYDLGIDYTDLSAEARVVLCEPLALALFAYMNKIGAIKGRLDVLEVTKTYLDHLTSEPVKHRRLEQDDLNFLQSNLMPLMIGEQFFQNRITAERIAQAAQNEPVKYQALWDLIRYGNREEDRKQNPSFIRLVDANILAHRGRGDNFEIFFSSEHYWDYFGGIRFYEIYGNQVDSAEKFGAVIRRVKRQPFLWGAVENALLRLVRDRKTDIFRQLAESDSEECRSMAAVVLSRISPSEIELIRQILIDFIGRTNLPILTKPTLNRAIVAIDVAGSLGELDILGRLLVCRHQPVQDRAILAVYEMWGEKQQDVLLLLERLTNQLSISSLLFKRSYLPAAAYLSVLIYMKHLRDPDQPGQKIIDGWKSVLNRLLLYRPDRNPSLERIISVFREVVLAFAITYLSKILRSFPNRYLVISLGELKEYYQLPQQVKDEALRLVPFLDMKFHDSQEFRHHLDALFERSINGDRLNNMLLKLLVDYALVAQALSTGDWVVDLTREYAYREINSSKATKRIMWDKGWVFAVLAFLAPGEIPDGLYDLYAQYVIDCFTRVDTWCGTLGEYAYLGYADIILIEYQKQKKNDLQIVREMMEFAVARAQFQKILDILVEMRYLVGSAYWQTVLHVIEPALTCLDPDQSIYPSQSLKFKNAINESLVELLAIIYFKHPIELDSYLMKNSLAPDVIEQIRVKKVDTRLAGDLIKGGLGAWGQFSALLSFSSVGQPMMIWAFQTALGSKNLGQFLNRVSKRALNLILNEQVFRVE